MSKAKSERATRSLLLQAARAAIDHPGRDRAATRPTPGDVLNGERVIALNNGAHLCLSLWGCNVLALPPAERLFVEQLLEQIEAFETKRLPE